MAAGLRRPRPGNLGIAHPPDGRPDRLRQDLRRLAAWTLVAAQRPRGSPTLPHRQRHGPDPGARRTASPRQARRTPRPRLAAAVRTRNRRVVRRPRRDPPQLGARSHRPPSPAGRRGRATAHPRVGPPRRRPALGHHQGDARTRGSGHLRLQLRLLATQPFRARDSAGLERQRYGADRRRSAQPA